MSAELEMSRIRILFESLPFRSCQQHKTQNMGSREASPTNLYRIPLTGACEISQVQIPWQPMWGKGKFGCNSWKVFFPFASTAFRGISADLSGISRDILGYTRISRDIPGYPRISRDISDIPGYPEISRISRGDILG